MYVYRKLSTCLACLGFSLALVKQLIADWPKCQHPPMVTK